MIIDLEKSGAWNVQLTIAINFISSKDVDKERIMHLKSNNVEFKTYDNVSDITDELFKALLSHQ